MATAAARIKGKAGDDHVSDRAEVILAHGNGGPEAARQWQAVTDDAQCLDAADGQRHHGG